MVGLYFVAFGLVVLLFAFWRARRARVAAVVNSLAPYMFSRSDLDDCLEAVEKKARESSDSTDDKNSFDKTKREVTNALADLGCANAKAARALSGEGRGRGKNKSNREEEEAKLFDELGELDDANTFTLLLKLLATADRRAQNKGFGAPGNESELEPAKKFLRKAFEQGSASIKSFALEQYFYPLSPFKDENEGRRALQCLEEAKDAEPIFLYAHRLACGNRLSEAISMYRKAAELGSTKAAAMLAFFYERGKEGVVEPSAEEAEKWLRKLEESNDPDAMNLYASICFELNDYEFLPRARGAVELGSAEAALALEKLYSEGATLIRKMTDDELEETLGKDEKSRLMRAAIKRAKCVGFFSRALPNYALETIETDVVEARKWARKFEELASGDELFARAQSCETKSKPEEALDWYRKAAEKGSRKAMRKLAELLSRGSNAKKNKAEAERWYRELEESADPELIFKFAEFNEKNKLSKNAFRWYRKAAELGSPSAMRKIADYYAKGRVVKPDDVEAARWEGMADLVAAGNKWERQLETADVSTFPAFWANRRAPRLF